VFLKLDAVFVQLATCALSSNTIELLKDRQAAKLRNNRHLAQAIRVTFVFEREVEDRMTVGISFSDVPRITPDANNPEIRASKAAKISADKDAVNSNATARNNGNGGNGSNGGSDGDSKKRTNQKNSGGAGLVAAEKTRREPSELGFFCPKPGCSIKKMFGKILEADKEAKLPCYDWHAKGLTCTRKDCQFGHGVLQTMSDHFRTCILDSMLEHKCATLNRDLMKNKGFKRCIDNKYAELWNDPAVSNNDG
jgi:hypothetical protein